jgi:hypothetical protein
MSKSSLNSKVARTKLKKLSKDLKVLMRLVVEEEAKKIQQEVDRLRGTNGKNN